ncbi:hypothetical protein ACVIWV_010395 [Bradyrhizobium diazoefficiens]
MPPSSFWKASEVSMSSLDYATESCSAKRRARIADEIREIRITKRKRAQRRVQMNVCRVNEAVH